MTTLIASTSWAPFFQTAIGALIGAGGAIGGGAFASWFTWQKERQYHDGGHIAKRVRNRIRPPGKAADENQDETRRPERRKRVLSFDASSCLAVGS
jgi:hypothetical protein